MIDTTQITSAEELFGQLPASARLLADPSPAELADHVALESAYLVLHLGDFDLGLPDDNLDAAEQAQLQEANRRFNWAQSDGLDPDVAARLEREGERDMTQLVELAYDRRDRQRAAGARRGPAKVIQLRPAQARSRGRQRAPRAVGAGRARRAEAGSRDGPEDGDGPPPDPPWSPRALATRGAPRPALSVRAGGAP